MNVYERIKQAGINIYDLTRLNEANIDALLKRANILDELLTVSEINDYDIQRKLFRDVSDCLAESAYALNNNLNSDILNSVQINPLGNGAEK